VLDRCEHRIEPLAVQPLQTGQVRVVVEGLEHARHRALGERRGMEIGGLLGDGEGADGVLVGHGISKPQARSERLREGAQMDDGRVRIEAGEGRQGRATVA
jgi:hypothetical protein